MTGGSLCDEMRAGSAAIWDGLHAHPFVRELADGTLPLESFRFFLEQDTLYLVEYARCLAMGAANSRDDTELRAFTADLNQVLDGELPSTGELLSRAIEMGAADRGGALGMAPATVAYTSYLRNFDRRALEDGLGRAARRELGEIFAMSSRLERGFWEMAYTLEQWPDLRAMS